ncbi:MAG: hypothetical protein N2517_02775 [Ignavibacteria bacterium]|nr:hypothetical protein [Ignavibacteria bacterium]
MTKNFSHKAINFVWISLLVAIVTFPRFNRQDLFIEQYTSGEIGGDQVHYYKLVEVFKEKKSLDQVKPPYNSRILPSLLASFLPFSPGISLNLINLLCLLVGFCFSYKTLIDLNLVNFNPILISAVHIVSFPVFYYGTIGFIDSILIAFYMVGIYFLINKKISSLAILIFFGVFVKETIFILVIVSVLYLFISEKSYKKILFIIASYLIGFVLLKIILFYNTKSSYLWLPSLEVLYQNIFRIRTYLTFLLSSIPIFILLFIAKKFIAQLKTSKLSNLDTNDKAIIFSMTAGIIISYSIFIYSLFSAYTDGRFIWLSYPFSTILMGLIANKLTLAKT